MSIDRRSVGSASNGSGSSSGGCRGDSINMAEEGKTSVVVAPTASPESMDDIPQTVLELPECKVETVVVYLDRAEICRSLRTSLKSGENELLLKRLSSCVDKDSIRVEGRGGATITEVSFLTKQLTPEEESSHVNREKEFKDKLEASIQRREVLRTKKHRLKKQRDVLDGFADNVMRAGSASDTENDKTHFLDTNVLQGMAGFFSLYEEQATRLDNDLQRLELELEELGHTISAIERNLENLGTAKEDREARELSILLETADDIDVELFVSYVVNKAKWSPKYDIRVFSNDNTMKILYYGMVQQSTGEDWSEARLCLSTAMPSIGGVVPDLGTQRLAFKSKPDAGNVPREFGKPPRLSRVRRRSLAGFYSPRVLNSEDVMTQPQPPPEDTLSVDALPQDYVTPSMDTPSMDTPSKARPGKVKESITSTMYEITRRTSIPSDNQPHKVSVAIIDLKPTFEYESVPKRAAHAYLKAKVKNTSPYALLAGPTNIFLDNNFIAKAELKAVSPSEDFTCSLGVDPGVRVQYHPVHKFREATGIVSKTVSTTYKQSIEIKNTHPEPLRIMIVDQVPISTEEKIKVSLQEPVIKHPEKYDRSKPIRLNKMNNVEWDLEIAPGETKELHLKYTIDYPATEEVESCVIHLTESQC